MSFPHMRPFRPLQGVATQSVTVSGSNQVITLSPLQIGHRQIRVYNGSGNTVFVEFGSASTVTASTATSVPIPNGGIEVYTIGPDIGYVGVISTGAGTSIYFTQGEGV